MAFKKRLPLIFLIISILAIVSFSYWWMYLRNRVETDDAYVKSTISIISSKVPGTVLKLLVKNDDYVKKGDLLVVLDPKDYQVEVDGRRATIERIKAQIEEIKKSILFTKKEVKANIDAAKSTYEAAKAKSREAKAGVSEVKALESAAISNYITAKRDYDRFKNLFKEGAIGKQKLDHMEDVFQGAKAKLNSIKSKLKAAKALYFSAKKNVSKAKSMLKLALASKIKIDVLNKKLKSLNAMEKETKALLEGALLKLSYCKIYAPISGYISQKHIEIGEKIQPTQPLMAVVPLKSVYVEANFKETQLKDVRIGQKATVVADIYPDVKFYGHVAGIRAGTGAAFSLLPPENATGNWIKVVQRVPVKIYLDNPPLKKYPLRVGLSVKVTIDTSNKNGAKLR